jgi:hypothetical protein
MVAIAYTFDEERLRPAESWPRPPGVEPPTRVGRPRSIEPDAPLRASAAVRATRGSSGRFRRRRLAVLAVVALVVVPAMAALATSPSEATSAPPAASEPLLDVDLSGFYLAQPGDTLWTIAQRLAPGTDPRPLVDRLAQLNGGASIQPGQRIMLE